jgi:hypothetical protein
MIKLSKHIFKHTKPAPSSKLLTSVPLTRSITSLQKYKPGFILNKLKKIMRSRSAIYKLLFVTSSLQIAYFTIRSFNTNSSTILSVKDLLSREDINDDDTFELVPIQT